jgi:hypothetical protein
MSVSVSSSSAAGRLSVLPYRNTFLMCLSRCVRWKGREGSLAMLFRAKNPCFTHPIKRADRVEGGRG